MLPGGGQQTMQYYYVARTAPTGSDDLNSNDLQTGVFHPDKTTGLPSGDPSQSEVFVYNRLGQPKKAHYDRNGTYHDFSYDVVGRQTEDSITILGGGLDNSVQRLATAYDEAGRPSRFTSWSLPLGSGGVVRNEVERTHNGLGQLTHEYQCHTGLVSTCSGGAPVVQYAHSEANNGSNQYVNHSRPTSMTYPNGRVVNYTYSGTLNDAISRLHALTNGGTTYEQYAYLGLGTVVRRFHLQGSNELGLTYLAQGSEPNSDAGDKYTGLDRFGRVVDQRILDSGSPTSPLDRFQYGYDKSGNRLYRDNLLSNDHDELYHANGASAGYDNFNQLPAFRRGPLSDANSDGVPDTVTTAGYWQTWTLDIQGNWDSVTTNGTAQTRTHNKQNQIATLNGSPTTAYDNNGAMTTDEQGRTLTYDAWGRLVQVANGSTHAYAYDALHRRVKQTAGTATDYYYSEQWQVLEERVGGVVKVQNLWSPVYVDALIRRDRDTGGAPDLDEVLYVQQDANWNVTGVANPSGGVQERYVYEPYGKPTRLTAGWGTPGADTINWVYLHQGGRYEAATGLYHFRHRELSAALGRWNKPDPMGFAAGDTNPYRYVHNQPTNLIDPTGLVGKVYVFAFEGFGGKYVGQIELPLIGRVVSPLRQSNHIGMMVIASIRRAGKDPVYSYYGFMGVGAEGDMKTTIARIRQNASECNNKIIVLGYSWGASTATRVVRNVFRDTGYKVRLVYTIDPVRKPPLPDLRVPDFTQNYGAGNYTRAWINWFQETDTRTLWPIVIGGIQGSQVDGAVNHRVTATDFLGQRPRLLDPRDGHVHILFYQLMLDHLEAGVDIVSREVL